MRSGDVTVQPWVRRGGPTVLCAALLLYLAAYARWPGMLVQVDLQVYRFGAMRVRDGLDLYSIGLTGNPKTLLFIYPPFAALGLLPLAYVSEPTVQVLWLVLMCGLITHAIRCMLTSMGLTAAGGSAQNGLWSLTALLVGLVVWIEPVRLSLQLGQINIVILVLVLADLLGSPQRKWVGIGAGVAAGIKLTPALFIVYLAADRPGARGVGGRRNIRRHNCRWIRLAANGFRVLLAAGRLPRRGPDFTQSIRQHRE